MATTSTGVSKLYSEIVADLVPYFMDAVLLPNPGIIRNSLTITGDAGDTVKFPLTNAYVNAGTVGEGNSISNVAVSDFAPTSVNIQVTKKGVATDVTSEALEDGLDSVVRTAVLNRLAGGLAQASDRSGLLIAATGFTTDTGAGSNASTHSASIVMSGDALGYVAKRMPSVSTWYDVDYDKHLFRGSIRDGYAVLRPEFGCRITSNATIGSGTANVEAIAKAVANLRASNAPVAGNGLYVGLIDPAFEFAINQQLAQVGGSTISSLSDLGNNALRDAMIAMIAGTMLYRSNNLPLADAL